MPRSTKTKKKNQILQQKIAILEDRKRQKKIINKLYSIVYKMMI